MVIKMILLYSLLVIESSLDIVGHEFNKFNNFYTLIFLSLSERH